MNLTFRSYIVDKNNKLYEANKTITDTGVTVKECVIYQLNGPYKYSACIDKNGYIHLNGSKISSSFCTQTQYSCGNNTTKNIKVSKIGQYNDNLYVKSTDDAIYVWDISHSYFVKTNISENSITWLENKIANYTSDNYNYSTKVEDYKNALTQGPSSTKNLIKYYGDNEPTTDLSTFDFNLIKLDDGWKYTRLNSNSEVTK